jgi:hypothetical protein
MVRGTGARGLVVSRANGLRQLFAILVLTCVLVPVQPAAWPQAPAAAPAMTCGAMEEFLRTAKIGKKKDTDVGFTAPSRATFDDGKLQHEAGIQTIDRESTNFLTSHGVELNFVDSWKYNVAGYELAKLLELNLVPPYVERQVDRVPASVSWWVGGTMMESERQKKKLMPPDVDAWAKQIFVGNVFHELIQDTDPNNTNMLITPEWRLWLIDFTRAFRNDKRLLYPNVVKMCDRKLLAKMRELKADVLKQKLGRWLSKEQIEGILGRRDILVKFFDKEIAEKGEAKVLYDLPQMNEPCGATLQ